MKIEYEAIRMATAYLSPGDRVLLVYPYRPSGFTIIKRLVENENGIYAVFEDGSWRSADNYGKTWWKVEE